MGLLELRDYAWMSQASYLDLKNVIEGNVATLLDELEGSTFAPDKQFAEIQAKEFTDASAGYYFVDHMQDDATSGFSASVFSSNNNSEYTIAIRGTDPNKENQGVRTLDQIRKPSGY